MAKGHKAKGHIPLYVLEARLGKLSRVVASRQKSGERSPKKVSKKSKKGRKK